MEEVTKYATKLLGCKEPVAIDYKEIDNEMLKISIKTQKSK